MHLKVFLCHSSGDKPTVWELYHQLNAEGWIDAWLDEKKLLPGQDWSMEIEKAVEEADIVIVCLSTRSVNKEGYVQRELRFVLNIAHEKPEDSVFVIPLRLDDCIIPRRLGTWQWVDYFPEQEKRNAYQRLLASLKLRAGRLGIPIQASGIPRSASSEIPKDKQRAERKIESENVTSQKNAKPKPSSQRAASACGIFRPDPESPPPSSTPYTATCDIDSTIISEKDGMTLICVPEGEFTMGSDADAFVNADEQPAHTLSLQAFWIDKTEVTNAMFAKCVQEDACNPPDSIFYGDSNYANHPVRYVLWRDANTYCSWADRRLPTEAEWEKAARGENALVYPWGNDAPSDNLLNFNNNEGETTAVGTYPNGASPYGALDMAGNVWEWVYDWLDAYPGGEPHIDFGEKFRVLRGGSWLLTENSERDIPASARGWFNDSDIEIYGNTWGFRCAMDATP